MLQRLLDVRPTIRCESLHGAITGVVQQLLIVGHPVVELIRSPADGEADDEDAVFDRIRSILVESLFIDADVPIDELASGRRRLRIRNPHNGSRHLPIRVRLSSSSEPAAVLLHAFLVLRVLYQTTVGNSPTVRLEAPVSDDEALDTLYLVGDTFTERYPVAAELAKRSDRVLLTLIGEPALISGGLKWPRDDYVRCRDASLLIKPLWEALEGAERPFVIPREVRGALGAVRVRLPELARPKIRGVRWLATLQELKNPAGGDTPDRLGPHGEHYELTPTSAGHIAATGAGGVEVILPVRSIAPVAPVEPIVPESEDGSIAISFEALGGAREIGANCYYYAFGHRGLVVDAGFDATRDGWLGLPALERISRLDAIVLTHAHLDHIGALPLLLAAFPDVPVYCTRATLAVIRPQLQDSAKVGQIRFEQTHEASSVSRGLVDSIPWKNFRLLDYGVREEVEGIPGLFLEFSDAGHIIGSATARLEFGGTSILHTGDISVEDQHLLRGMRVSDVTADHVVMEGTYCGEPEFTRQHRREAVDQFLAAIAERIDAGGSILIPAFSLGRAQEIVGMLVDWNDRTGRAVPIWTAGLVNTLNEVSAAHPEFLPGISGNPFARVRAFPTKRGLLTDEERRNDYARTFHEIARQAPCVVIASHGMMTENTGSYMIGRAILGGDDPRHAICLCGYMDPRTPGFRLRFQCDEPVIDYGIGDPIFRKIPSERIQFHRLTAHASYEELVEVAFRVPKRSVTFIHGDGAGLDKLRNDLLGRFAADGRSVIVRVPAIREQFLLERVHPPATWNVEPGESTDSPMSLGPGRWFDRASGFSIRGMTADRRWALVPIGEDAATLALEHDRIDAGRIERVEIHSRGSASRVVFDRSRGQGDLTRIRWDQLGKVTWIVVARDPEGQLVRSEFPVTYGAAIRATQTSLEAISPILELEIGGTLEPILDKLTVGSDGKQLAISEVSWDADIRTLRVRFSGQFEVGSLGEVFAHLRWPNGFRQGGLTLGTITFEPRVQCPVMISKVGIPTAFVIDSKPEPRRVRVGLHIAQLNGNRVQFVAKRPGSLSVELEYQTINEGREWREVGSVEIQPAIHVTAPTSVEVGESFSVVTGDIEPTLHGTMLTLRVGSNSYDRWRAAADPHSASLVIEESGDLDIEVSASESDLILWSGRIRVREGLELDFNASRLVTTINTDLIAKVTWKGSRIENRAAIERSFAEAGFFVVGWNDTSLELRGTEATLGTRGVLVGEDVFPSRVNITTLWDLQLSLRPAGPFSPGDATTLRIAGGDLSGGLQDLDGGPLTIEVDRIAPLFDSLSSRVIGSRVHLLHPGRYSIALVAAGRRIAEVSADVCNAPMEGLASVTATVAQSATSADAASVQAGQLSPLRSSVILSQSRSAYRVLQDSTEQVREATWQFIAERLQERSRLVVSWPGLTLGKLAGHLIRRIRDESPTTVVAHLPYPAPRGELADSVSHARNLRRHRILCSAPASSMIDRFDNYLCRRCSVRPVLRSDHSRIWVECPGCGYSDHDLVLTLAGLRSTDVQVLFADYRMAKYLTRGVGTRYAGAFGRSVRCRNCDGLQPAFSRPAPWDGAELHRLVGALIANWNVDNETSRIRRAARFAAGRTHRSTPDLVPRLERELRRLVEAHIVVDGVVVGSLERLEAGVSLCCGKPLAWSRQQISHVFTDLEELLSPGISASLHPELSKGHAGIRQFLALAD